jgi:hypothetical protein
VQLGDGATAVTAAIAPGLVTSVGIRSHAPMAIGDRVPVRFKPSILALDGERELPVNAQDEWEVELSWDGPRVLDIEKVMNAVRVQRS